MDRVDKLAHVADALTQINLSIQIEGEEVQVGPLIGWAALELTRSQRNEAEIEQIFEGVKKWEGLAG
jgi:hypothetical protein